MLGHEDHQDVTPKVVILGMDFVIIWTRKLLKNLKMPFFSKYSKFLSIGNLNWSRTLPKFFSKKNSKKHKSCRKFWPKWAVAGRLIENGKNYFVNLAQALGATAENFSSIP